MNREALDIIVEVTGNIFKVERDTGNIYIWGELSGWGQGARMGWDANCISSPEKQAAQAAAIAKFSAILVDGVGRALRVPK